MRVASVSLRLTARRQCPVTWVIAAACVVRVSVADGQTAIACPAPTGTAPAGITVTTAPPNVSVQWTALTGVRGYAVARRNPDGTCWNLTPTLITATSLQEPIPTLPGTYAYQVGALTLTGPVASQWMPLTVAAPTVASRRFFLAGFTAAGVAPLVSSRAFTLAGITATGAATPVASRRFFLVGFVASGSSAPTSGTTAPVVADGSPVKSRAFTLPGWTASGRKKP